MKKKIMFIIGIFVTFFCYMNVYAADACESSELSRLRKLAEKVEFDYSYEIKEIENDDNLLVRFAEYNLNVVNLNSEIQVYVTDTKSNITKMVKASNGNSGSVGTFFDGDTLEIKIQAYTRNACSGKTIITKKIKLPYYNVFSTYNICQNDDFCGICSEFLDHEYSVEEFKKDVDKCYATRNHELIDNITKNNSNNNDNLSKSYLWYYFGGIALLLIIMIILLIFSKRKKRKTIVLKRGVR